MRVMFIAFATTIVIAFVADFVLDQIGFSSQERQTAESVRVE